MQCTVSCQYLTGNLTREQKNMNFDYKVCHDFCCLLLKNSLISGIRHLHVIKTELILTAQTIEFAEEIQNNTIK